ncbi:hypothetical protein SAMN05444679_119115 [Variovorax sp. CF079]|uniref:hypothetical protein n=1 Tax=Variovorax sp. CF079 TaxID=1882774 RepID=UPI00088E0C1E|nr:hypothetical protein [Variovorax sp. CF079]SDE24891.1 hypothetical protein SAMN05444679_119115 [Variovorax sp. CF079]
MFERDQSHIAKLSAVMCRRSFHRRMTAFFVVLSLLFSQLALANYVCPGAADAVAMAEMMAAGEPCEGMDSAQPVLCHQHAADMSLSFEPVKLATPSLPAIVQVLVVPVVMEAQLAAAIPVAATPEVRPPPGPVFLATRRLRV